MKQSIRAFSVGLFTSGIILLIIFIFFGDTNNTKTKLSDEEMTAELEDSGYHVLTDSDYVAFSVDKDEDKDKDGNNDSDQNESEEDSNNDEVQEKNDDEDADKDDKDESDEKETYSITVEEGMAPSDIGNDLEKHDIIDDAAKFNKFLHDEGYDLKVQIGKFKVSDDMDFDEIADALTK